MFYNLNMDAKKDKESLNEIFDLLDRIIESSTDNKTPISEVLRLCVRLGSLLGNDEISTWALAELGGYKSNKNLPDYRIIASGVQGHFSGSFGSGLRNAHIPQSCVDEKHRDILFTNYMTEAVAELEELAKGDNKDQLTSYWNADAIAYYQRKEIYQGMVLSSAWRIMTKASIKGILDTIRTKVLELTLKIKKEMASKQPTKNFGSNNQSKVITQIFHNTIIGGQIALSNTGDVSQNNITIKQGDFNALKKYLKNIGITDSLIKELKDALKKDETKKEKPGPTTNNWLSKIMLLMGKGSLALATNASGSMIASALIQYLGQ